MLVNPRKPNRKVNVPKTQIHELFKLEYLRHWNVDNWDVHYGNAFCNYIFIRDLRAIIAGYHTPLEQKLERNAEFDELNIPATFGSSLHPVGSTDPFVRLTISRRIPFQLSTVGLSIGLSWHHPDCLDYLECAFEECHARGRILLKRVDRRSNPRIRFPDHDSVRIYDPCILPTYDTQYFICLRFDIPRKICEIRVNGNNWYPVFDNVDDLEMATFYVRVLNAVDLELE
jgi:hypothetical protein